MSSARPLTPEILVNTSTSTQEGYASIAALPNGGFVLTWQSNINGSLHKYYLQVFGANGQPVGGEIQFAEVLHLYGAHARVAALGNGKFVVTWQDFQQREVSAQVFNADGSASGGQLRVTTDPGLDYAPSVTPLSNGAFAITWARDGANYGPTYVFGKIYQSNGASSNEFRLNSSSSDLQFNPQLTTLSNGRFVAAWEDWGDQTAVVIRGQIFNADGSRSGSELLLSPSAAASGRTTQMDVELTALSGGGFVAMYRDRALTGETVYGQILDNAGNKLGSEFQVNAGGTWTLNPAVASLQDGGFVVTWSGLVNAHEEVLAQRYSATGSKVGTEFRVTTAGNQSLPSVAVLADGRMALSWQGYGPGDPDGVFVRLFSANSSAPEVAAGGGASFVEDGGAVPVAPFLALIDADGSTLTQATVQITQGLNAAQDVLKLVATPDTGSIMGTYEAATGTLHLSAAGGTNLAQWQAALRAVVYENSSQNPSTAPRMLSFTVWDAEGPGTPSITTVAVQAVNDAPVLTPSAGQAGFVEGNNAAATPVAVDPAIVLSDVDSSTFSRATVSIQAGFRAGEDMLALSGSFGNIEGSYNAATGMLTLTSANATATTLQWQAALRAVQYTNSSETPSADARTVQFIIQDSAGAHSTAVTRTVTVTPTNDTPLVAVPLSSQSVDQDSPFLFTIPSGSFTDADGDALSYTATRADGSALPAWLSFDGATRIFSGTPGNADVGALSVRVTATDGSGLSAFDDFTLTVANVNDAPTLALPLADQGATQGRPFHLTLPAGTFVDVDAGDTLAFTAALADGRALPAWLRFDATTGAFSGTPGNADVGALNIRLTATDREGLSVSDDFTLTVANVNDAPVLRNLPATALNVTVGVSAELPPITVSDPDGANVPLTLTLTAAYATLSGLSDADPAQPGLQISGTAAQINAVLAGASFTAWAAGPSTLAFSLSDGIAPPTQGQLSLSAAPPAGTPGIDWVHYAGSRADHVLTPGRDGVWTVRPVAGGPAMPLPGIERLQFDDGAVALDLQPGEAAGQAARLVFALWGQAGLQNPGLMGEALAYVDALGLKAMGEVAESLGLLAALAGGAGPGALLSLLHTNLLGRAPDAAQLQELLDFQAAGGHSAAELLTIATGLAQTSQALAPLQSTGLALTPFEGMLYGTAGDEVFRAQPGDAHIDAGPGLDTVVYAGQASQYTRSQDEAGRWIIEGRAPDGGQDLLQGVERLHFADHAVALDLEGAAGQALRLLAVVKGREALADRALLGEVIAGVDARGAQGLAQDLQAQGVVDALAGGDSLEALVTLLYRNVAGHAPTEAELQWTLAWAEAQQWDRADLLLQAAQLPQTAELIGLDALATQGVAYELWLG